MILSFKIFHSFNRKMKIKEISFRTREPLDFLIVARFRVRVQCSCFHPQALGDAISHHLI